uniref:Uncharacterized protein n=1 Tax=viral metagenome TaxID=1070528 RepID=A0A6M3LLD6_9ZZZZ
MKPKILTWGQIPFSEATPDAVLRQQARTTLRQVIEWKDEECLHDIYFTKGECPECWAELKEMCDE